MPTPKGWVGWYQMAGLFDEFGEHLTVADHMRLSPEFLSRRLAEDPTAMAQWTDDQFRLSMHIWNHQNGSPMAARLLDDAAVAQHRYSRMFMPNSPVAERSVSAVKFLSKNGLKFLGKAFTVTSILSLTMGELSANDMIPQVDWEKWEGIQSTPIDVWG